MKFTQKQIVILGAGFVFIVAIYFLLTSVNKKAPVAAPVSLSVWGTEPAATFNDLIALYEGYRPNVSVIYTQVDPGNYETKLLGALAAGTGPDIFEIGDHSVPRWQSVIAPMPMTSYFTSQFNLGQMKSYFPPVVAEDFSLNGQIYGLPLSIDTLSMVYNQDYFDSAGIALPPKTWDEFDADVLKLRVINASGTITRAAAAIGGSETSIANADDLLYLLMLQNGTQMVNSENSEATFYNTGGLSAFNFYLQFSNPDSPYYTWNDNMGDAVQDFAQGKTAVIFDYHSDLARIKKMAPYLNMAVAPIPQPSGATLFVNYPEYQGLVAARQGNVTNAWDFILYLTAYTSGESIYLRDTGSPAAQRLVLQGQEADTNLGIFATQALSAQSWYEADDQKIDAFFNTAIQSAMSGSTPPESALRTTQDEVSQVMY